MPLMPPGSPRPDADDGVYRSIFQQPQLEIPAIAPSYSWFEFLLHPEALQRHLKTLRHQQAHGTHGATSAMELVREFLDQAQLVADEGNGRNNRYHALLRVAAQVALQMEIPLENVETQLPAHFQRLLLDGIVDLAEAEDDGASKTKAKDPAMITVAHAHLLHQRWTLRTLVRESQNGYLTSTNKNDAEEQMSGFQVALSELAQHHLQIAQSLQQTLADDPRDALPVQAQFDAFYDLAVYFFSFNAYEKAYECFSRAFELVEDHGSGSLAQLPTAQRASLEGYLAACESVLEARSGGSGGGDTVMADADARNDGPFGNVLLLLDGDEAAPSEQAMDSRTEALLRAGAKRQRDHYRVVNDIHGLFTAWQHDDAAGATRMDPAALASTIRRAILSKTDSTTLPDDRGRAHNLVVFLMLHSCWDALAHWRELLPSDHVVRPLVGFAIACGSLVQYVATTVNGSPADGDYRQDFSVTRCNSILSELLTKRRELLSEHGINPGDDSDASNGPVSTDGEIAALLVDLPLWVMDTLVCVCAGLLHRSSMRSLSDHRVSFDLNPYGDVALLVAFAHENPKKKSDDDPTGVGVAQLPTTPFLKATLPEIVALHARGVQCLVRRCPREPRWHSARADLTLYPIVRLKQPSLSDPRAALCGYLAATSLATNYFCDDVSVVDVIDQSSLVRLSQCLIKTGAHVAAAVLYQCFAPDEAKYGLRVLQIAPESHDAAFFQYFWALPFLELLVHLHSNPKHFNHKYVTLLTHLLQSPELNCSNPTAVQKEVEQRILRCYFRDLCKTYLS